MKIIQANLDYLEVVTSLFDGYRQFYKQKSDISAATNFIRERIINKEAVIFLALINEAGAGFTQLYPLFSSVSMQRLWILNDLYVAPQYRRQNIGAELLNAAVNLGRETGAVRITLETDADNFQAQKLYEKSGWQKDGHFFYNYNLD
jgi:ribosomal protein S18 acetylase RimI-like enzyme